MTKENATQLAFNRGLISKLALARVDLKRMAFSAETQTNWMPRVLGSMMLRPGLGYLNSTKSDAAAVYIPFIFSLSDTALIELTASTMRVSVSDSVITRPSVSASITNGDFTSALGVEWEDHDQGSAVSQRVGNTLELLGTGTDYARRDQHITITETGTVHALAIDVTWGPVEIKLGNSEFSDEYISTTLDAGHHSLAFTPTTTPVYLTIRSRLNYSVTVNSVSIESSGAMEVTTPWSASDLVNIRHDQSGDIIFCACKDNQQYKIERRGTESWSVAKYFADDGPFRLLNTSTTTMTPSGLSGDITITSSTDYFGTGDDSREGGIISISSTGQEVSAAIAAEDTFTDEILVQGVEATRVFTVIISGIAGGTIVTLQRSIEVTGSWEDISPAYTADTTVTYDDTLDNQLVYYRIGVKTGEYGSGTATCTLRYSSGSITGIARITGYTSTTVAPARVLKAFGGIEASDDWAEGEWSTRRGFPTSVAFAESRLFWAGKDKIWGSATDSFYSFSDDIEGDSGPINRSIGSGPVDNINWLVSSSTLLVGGEAAIKSARSSSLEEPLTPTNFNLKDIATHGSSSVQAVKVDNQTMFVHASQARVYEMAIAAGEYSYSALDTTAIVPEIGDSLFTRVAVQRQPDTRLHFVRTDGKVAILIYDKVEDVKCWVLFETDGVVEDVIVLPGTTEDNVYYLIKRTINSVTKRYLEKWTQESYGKGNTDSRLADSHLIYSGASTTSITGLGHLEGESVVVWGNTKDLGTYTVSSGAITLSEAVTWCCVGLSYTADFKSAKPTIAMETGTSLMQKKHISQMGVILADTHYQGLKYGPDENNLDDLPLVEDGAATAADTIHTAYDEEPFPFPGVWDTDSRLFLRATAPRPCTVLAALIDWNAHGKF